MADVRISQEVELKGLFSAILQTRTSVGVAATAIPAANLANRKTIIVKNNGSATIYLGNSTVTTANGWPLDAGQVLIIDLADTVTLYGIVSAGTVEAATLEVS